MESIEEIIRKWQKLKEERFETIKKILVNQGFTMEKPDGSHYVFRHPLLTEFYKNFPDYFHQDFAPDGSLVIVCHGKKVKCWYVRRAADALEKLEEIKKIER